MNDFDALIAGGMAQATGVLGEPIVIDGATYQAVVDNFRLTRAMQEAGYDPGYTLTAVISRVQMPQVPTNDQKTLFGVYQGRSVQVMNSEADNAAVTFYLMDVK